MKDYKDYLTEALTQNYVGFWGADIGEFGEIQIIRSRTPPREIEPITLQDTHVNNEIIQEELRGSRSPVEEQTNGTAENSGSRGGRARGGGNRVRARGRGRGGSTASSIARSEGSVAPSATAQVDRAGTTLHGPPPIPNRTPQQPSRRSARTQGPLTDG